MDAFKSSASFYELLSDTEGRLRREGPLLEECLRRAPGPSVVDLACGTGLHAEFFAGLGARVSARDVSAEMIAHARQRRPHADIEYTTGDMRELKGGRWDLAVCLGNSLSLLSSIEDTGRVMRSVYSALVPGGMFLTQVLNCLSEDARRPRHRVERKGEVVAVKSLVPHGERTLLSLAFYSFAGGEPVSLSETAVLLHFTRESIASLAGDAGFRAAEVYGDFDRGAYEPDRSPDLICLFQKPAG